MFSQSWEANFLGFLGIHLENIAVLKIEAVWLRGGDSACALNIEKAVPMFSMVLMVHGEGFLLICWRYHMVGYLSSYGKNGIHHAIAMASQKC